MSRLSEVIPETCSLAIILCLNTVDAVLLNQKKEKKNKKKKKKEN